MAGGGAANSAADSGGGGTSGGGVRHRRFRKSPRSGSKGRGGGGDASARQRNLKQKFVALLKKFKVADPEALDREQVNLDQKLSGEFVSLAKILHTCLVKTRIDGWLDS